MDSRCLKMPAAHQAAARGVTFLSATGLSDVFLDCSSLLSIAAMRYTRMYHGGLGVVPFNINDPTASEKALLEKARIAGAPQTLLLSHAV